MTDREIRIAVGDASVSGRLGRPPDARALYVYAHGAGAGMRHPFLQTTSDLLAERGIATLRYQFPYMEAGKGRPDRQALLLATVRAAVEQGVRSADGLPVFAGGKSMGGRMTSLTDAEGALPVRGIAFAGFPLHPPGREGIERAAHLADTHVPLLFIQGTRDDLARLDLLEPVIAGLGERATLHVIHDANHGFAVRKRETGRSNADVLVEIADVLTAWITRVGTAG